MISTEKLEDILIDQLQAFNEKELGVPRDIDFDKYINTKQITVVSGIRRSGKSTLLAQFAKRIKHFYYVSFDDERLIDFQIKDFDALMLVFNKMYSAKTIFIDEIQNVEKWELFVRRLYEEGYKIFVTGSNAKLLSSELATRLTGRYFKIELFPFSFKEFLNFKKIIYQKKGTQAKSKILNNFSVYLKKGGFPGYIRYGDSEFVKRIYEDVMYKDLLVRFKIKETKSFRELANFLFSNFTEETRNNNQTNIALIWKIKQVINFQLSITNFQSIINY